MSAEYDALVEAMKNDNDGAKELLEKAMDIALDEMHHKLFDPAHVVVAILTEPQKYHFALDLMALGLEAQAVRRTTQWVFPQTNRQIVAQVFTPAAKTMCRMAVEIATKRCEVYNLEFKVTPYDIGAAALLSGSYPLEKMLDGQTWELPFAAVEELTSARTAPQ